MTRPYWHVDAKWICGGLFTVVLIMTLIVSNLVTLTSEKVAVDSLTLMVASSFSRNGLDNTSEIDEVRTKIAASPDGAFIPLPGINIGVTESDMLGKTPRELRLWLFRQLVEPAYKKGPEGIFEIMSNQKMKENLSGQLAIFNLINAKTHDTLKRVLLFFIAACVIFMAPFVFFSRRLGRFVSPGLVMFVIGSAGTAFFSLLNAGLTTKTGASIEPVSYDPGAMLRLSLTEAASAVVPSLAGNYKLLASLGAGLLLIAFFAKIFLARKQTA